MEPESPGISHDGMMSPHAREIEYALNLSHMISKVREDPAQLRSVVYEFARARLLTDTSHTDETERRRLSEALETAIQGVEQFSVRREERERLQPPASALRIAPPPSASTTAMRQISPSEEDVLVPRRAYIRPPQPAVEVRSWSTISPLTLGLFCIVISFFIVAAGWAYNWQQLQLMFGASHLPPSVAASPVTPPKNVDVSQQASATTSNSFPFPIPSDYGIYALNNAKLTELYLLPERVPDKRIAISTPVEQPSRSNLTDGKASFILFRRDLANNAPDRVEVRVVARVARALTFDAKGKPSFSQVSGLWNIRGVSYEFRVRPLPGNSEMLLVQPEKDFVLPPGRYVLVIKDQGYDFTVAGNVTDLAHCLERTDAANGAFYSECQKL